MAVSRKLLHCLVSVLIMAALTGCSGGELIEADTGERAGENASPWAPTTKALEPDCPDCEVVRRYDEAESSHGGELQILLDPEVDDEVTQWGRCIFSFVQCAQQGNELPACVDGADCPAVCKDEFTAAEGANGSRAEQYRAFESVFIDDGAFCTPNEPGSLS